MRSTCPVQFFLLIRFLFVKLGAACDSALVSVLAYKAEWLLVCARGLHLQAEQATDSYGHLQAICVGAWYACTMLTNHAVAVAACYRQARFALSQKRSSDTISRIFL
eukprot:2917782-Amphidinium_carterae.1